jgi:hypothetical protein
MNRRQIESRVVQAARQTLFHQHYVSAMDVLIGIGLLQSIHVKAWRQGKIPYLEKVIQGSLEKISYAMKCFRHWALQEGLKPSQTAYMRQTRQGKQLLQFSKSGTPSIEYAYSTHYISPLLSEKKQQKIQEKCERAPDQVVFMIIKDSQCSRCQKELGKNNFLIMDSNQPLCLSCARLDQLVFLPRGDAQLTRRAKQYSSVSIVVVRFSRTGKRYERQGLLVEELALEKAQQELHP